MILPIGYRLSFVFPFVDSKLTYVLGYVKLYFCIFYDFIFVDYIIFLNIL